MPRPTTENSVTFHAVTTVKTNCATKQQDIASLALQLGMVFFVKMKFKLPKQQVCLNKQLNFLQFVVINLLKIFLFHFFLVSTALFLRSSCTLNEVTAMRSSVIPVLMTYSMH